MVDGGGGPDDVETLLGGHEVSDGVVSISRHGVGDAGGGEGESRAAAEVDCEAASLETTS